MFFHFPFFGFIWFRSEGFQGSLSTFSLIPFTSTTFIFVSWAISVSDQALQWVVAPEFIRV